MWSLTGEEAPLAQLRGMVEWLGNVTREQPNTAPDVPIQHTDVNPYGINTFLEQEVEPAKREQQVKMIAEAGFHWLRQQFPWQDIEIAGRGDFTDARNADSGVISAWDKYDNIVDLARAVRAGNSSAHRYAARVDARRSGDRHARPARQSGRLRQLPDDLRRALQGAHPLLSNLERAEHLPGVGQSSGRSRRLYADALPRLRRAQGGRSGERGHQRGALADHLA